MGSISRYRTERTFDHSSNLIIIDRSWSTRTGLIQEPFDAALQKAPTPLANGVLVQAKLVGNGLAGYTFRTPEDNPAPIR
jgi:hypothetical protein